MKKFLMIVNIMGIYLIPLLFVLVIVCIVIAPEDFISSMLFKSILYVGPVYALILLVVNVIASINILRGRGNIEELVKSYFLIKVIQIPAYIVIFIVGAFCFFRISTMLVTLATIVIDIISIAITTILGLAIFQRMRKADMIENSVQFSMSIGSFLFCFDVGIAITGYRISKGQKQRFC